MTDARTILNTPELFDRLRLYRTQGIGIKTVERLFDRFKTIDKILQSNLKEWSSIESIKAELMEAERNDYFYFFNHMSDFPLNELDITNVIMCAGDKKLLKRPLISIVGSREASYHSLQFTKTISRELREIGYGIVSGLARGIDSSAHTGAGADNTIAILSGGIDMPWPPENRSLYEEIKNKGLIISDMPLGVSPSSYYFVKRNRLIASISKTTIIVESRENSGSIHTAMFANEYKKLLLACPSFPNDDRNYGNNRLLLDGIAKPIYSISHLKSYLTGSREDGGRETVVKKLDKSAPKFSVDVLNLISSIPTSRSNLYEEFNRSITLRGEKCGISEYDIILSWLELYDYIKIIGDGVIRITD
ncbi:MAG: DNA-protecting protein DprA [Alphaproteobacteria bacterium]|nr:DNA-protecting protein DprA [Alphaproteobacteria bacterium]MBL0717962.1 DNA-protecting protein DprA [Alphaproteobacteria bacterium]